MKEIRILFSDDNGRVTILDSEGKQYDLSGVVVFAGDGFSGESYIFGHGSAADAAFAFVEGYNKPSLQCLYKACAFQFTNRLDPRAFLTEGNAEEIAARWEKEDRGKEH